MSTVIFPFPHGSMISAALLGKEKRFADCNDIDVIVLFTSGPHLRHNYHGNKTLETMLSGSVELVGHRLNRPVLLHLCVCRVLPINNATLTYNIQGICEAFSALHLTRQRQRSKPRETTSSLPSCRVGQSQHSFGRSISKVAY